MFSLLLIQFHNLKEGTFTARTRPRIESHLGFITSDSEYESGQENGIDDDIGSVSSRASTGMISGLDTQELHEQFSAMLRKYQQGVEDFEASSATETEDKEGRQVVVVGPRGNPEGSTTTEDTTEVGWFLDVMGRSLIQG